MRRDQRLIEQAFKAVVMSAGVFAVVTRPVPRERGSDRRRSRGDRYRLIQNGPIQNGPIQDAGALR